MSNDTTLNDSNYLTIFYFMDTNHTNSLVFFIHFS